MAGEETKLTITQWVSLLTAIGGLGLGGTAVYTQQSAPPQIVSQADITVAVQAATKHTVERSELEAKLDRKVDRSELARLDASVSKLADAVVSLKIEVERVRGSR